MSSSKRKREEDEVVVIPSDASNSPHWKSNLKYLYDNYTVADTEWPTFSVAWGDVEKSESEFSIQSLYHSSTTDGSYSSVTRQWSGTPTLLQQSSVKVRNQFKTRRSNLGLAVVLDDYKSLVHPGECNRIRSCPQRRSILATHSDTDDVFIWNMTTATKEKFGNDVTAHMPSLTLKGHEGPAEFALNFSDREFLVASGGQDTNVLVWNLGDYETALSSAPSVLENATVLRGHDNTVEDVQFQPLSLTTLCSGGDDQLCLLWDTKAGTEPVNTMNLSGDVNCISWNPHNPNFLLAGCSDSMIHLIDIRKLGNKAFPQGIVHSLDSQQEQVMALSWNPTPLSTAQSFFASAGTTKDVRVWTLNGLSSETGTDKDKEKDKKSKISHSLKFHHLGHRGQINDLQWNSESPFSIASFSSDSDGIEGGGGNLHLWRMSPFLLPTTNSA